MELSQRDVNVAIGLMGGVMAAASADGARTGGRSPFFRTVLVGFGLHGVVHMAQALAYRGYTPGVATAPTVVVPYSLWAVRRLKAAGIESGGVGTAAASLAFLPVAVAGVHGLARRLQSAAGVCVGLRRGCARLTVTSGPRRTAAGHGHPPETTRTDRPAGPPKPRCAPWPGPSYSSA